MRKYPWHYNPDMQDLRFLLYDVHGLKEKLAANPDLYPDLNPDVVEDALDQVERLATEDIAASFTEADRNPPVFDGSSGTVTMNPAFSASYAAYEASGFNRLGLPPAVGGSPAPQELVWAFNELILGANPAVYMFGSGPGFASVLHDEGTAEQKRLAELMAENGWTATMVLTEPEAGSDFGAGKATAELQADGTWHIKASKRFISGAAHDMSGNIIHFVLARPIGGKFGEKGRPGTKGLSLFVVPQNHVDLQTGKILGPNGVKVTGVEDKMGLKASTTCDVEFGIDEPNLKLPAVGTLLGDVHDGTRQMFRVIEMARTFVGAKAIATLSAAAQYAKRYAVQRTQGRDITRDRDKTAKSVPIAAHADVRMHGLMKPLAFVEAGRSLIFSVGSLRDEAKNATDPARAEQVEARITLLLPIVKGFLAAGVRERLPLALEVLGGSGYLKDHPLEQYIRDSQIDPLYEGTTGIQALDHVFRGILRNEGRAHAQLMAEFSDFARSQAGNQELAEAVDAFAGAVRDAKAMVRQLKVDAFRWQKLGDDTRVYRIAAYARTLLEADGYVATGYEALRNAVVAQRALENPDLKPEQRQFYEAKVLTAHYYLTQEAGPMVEASRTRAKRTDLSIMRNSAFADLELQLTDLSNALAAEKAQLPEMRFIDVAMQSVRGQMPPGMDRLVATAEVQGRTALGRLMRQPKPATNGTRPITGVAVPPQRPVVAGRGGPADQNGASAAR